MNQKDTRWRQRFANFERAYKQLSTAVEQYDELNTLEKEGLIQRFEFDVVHYETLENRELKNLIDSEGIEFYCN